MPQLLTCPRGHVWKSTVPGGAATAVHEPACPICGSHEISAVREPGASGSDPATVLHSPDAGPADRGWQDATFVPPEAGSEAEASDSPSTLHPSLSGAEAVTGRGAETVPSTGPSTRQDSQAAKPGKQVDEWGDTLDSPPPPSDPSAGAGRVDEWGDTIVPPAEPDEAAATADPPAHRAVDDWGDTIVGQAGSADAPAAPAPAGGKQVDEWGDTVRPGDQAPAADEGATVRPQTGTPAPGRVEAGATVVSADRPAALAEPGRAGAPSRSDETVALTGHVAPAASSASAGTQEYAPSGSAVTLDPPGGPSGTAGTLEWGTRRQPGSDASGQMPTVAPGASGGTDLGFSTTEPAQGKQAGGSYQIAGYEILAELGRGGMGVVYKARQMGLNRLVALKMILSGSHATAKDLARFRIEGEAVARLQHPNIVQIYEVGEQDGSPYFSLEYIDGGNLAKKISKEPMSAKDSARIMLALADAMDCAHRVGIIHRDLKPANILLTPDGTPKITDFGLAKRLDEDSGQTRAGTVLGTPSYMPPEQAEGKIERLGTHSDIYSLGAILYDMVTGRPPFRGETLLDTLYLVKSQDPVPPARLQPKLSKDLETICLKCLQKEPEKRYKTAGDLAEDLRRFLAGEPIKARPTPLPVLVYKWTRRNQMATALIGVITVALVVGGVTGWVWGEQKRQQALTEMRLKQEAQLAQAEAEKQEQIAKAERDEKERQRQRAVEQEKIATEQRDRAEDNFRTASLAADRLLTHVGSERLRKVPEMEPVRKAILKDVVGVYGHLLQRKSDDPGTRLEVARAYHRVGDIHEKLANSEQEIKAAEPYYARAVAAYTQLAEEFPDQPVYRAELASTRNLLGILLDRTGRTAEAEKEYREALAIQQGLPAALGQRPEYREQHALICDNLGMLLRKRGELKEAEALVRESLRTKEGIVGQDPKNGKYLQELGRSYNALGELLQMAGRLPDAEGACGKAEATFRKLVAEWPDEPDYRQEWAGSNVNLGNLLRDQKPPEARKRYQEAITLYEGLRKKFPGTPQYQQELALAYNDLGILLQASGEMPQADKAYTRAAELQAELVKNFPEVAEYQGNLVRNYKNRGLQLQVFQKPKEAAEIYRKALDLCASLVQKFPDRPEFRQEQARLYAGLAALLQTSFGQRKEAEENYRRAAEIQKQLVAKFPAIPEYQQELGQSYLNLGILLHTAGNFPEAEKAYLAATQVFAKSAEKWPDMPILNRQERAKCTHFHAFLLSNAKRAQEAEAAYKEAIALRREIVKLIPSDAAARQDLATSYDDLAILYSKSKQSDAVEENFRHAVQVLQELDPAPPVASAPAYWQQLANEHKNLANHLESIGARGAEVEENRRRVAAVHVELAKAFPQAAEYKSLAGNSLDDLAGTLLARQKSADSLETLHKAIDFQRAAVQQNPQQPAFRQSLCTHYLGLGAIQVQLGNPAESAQALAELAKLLQADQLNYFTTAAGLLAQCMDATEKDAKLPRDKRAELNRAYAVQAIGLLRKALALGFNDIGVLENSPELEKLRARPEFRQMLADRQREKSLRRALPLEEKLVQDAPQDADYRMNLGRTLTELAGLVLQADNAAEAQRLLRQAVRTERAVFDRTPERESCRPELAAAYLRLAEASVRLGQPAEAAKALADLGPVAPAKWSEYPRAAALLARCAGQVERDEKLPAAKRKELAQTYGDEAVKLVRKALARGHRDAAFWKQPDFEVLRSRSDFQKLVADLEPAPQQLGK